MQRGKMLTVWESYLKELRKPHLPKTPSGGGPGWTGIKIDHEKEALTIIFSPNKQAWTFSECFITKILVPELGLK